MKLLHVFAPPRSVRTLGVAAIAALAWVASACAPDRAVGVRMAKLMAQGNAPEIATKILQKYNSVFP